MISEVVLGESKYVLLMFEVNCSQPPVVAPQLEFIKARRKVFELLLLESDITEPSLYNLNAKKNDPDENQW